MRVQFGFKSRIRQGGEKSYWIQGCDPLLAMVILVILIQHFLGICCATEFQATRIFKKIISWQHGHPKTVTKKF